MSQSETDFYAALKRGPALLMLGQDYLRLETGKDPFLSEVARKYGPSGGKNLDYKLILEEAPGKALEPALAWMHQLCERLPIPQWLSDVAKYAWSGIYSSAIDALWPRPFRSEWRELQPLFEEKYKPADPRNRFRLHCTFLFGCVDRTEEGERPPTTTIEWLNRKQIAVGLLRRLPEIVADSDEGGQ